MDLALSEMQLVRWHLNVMPSPQVGFKRELIKEVKTFVVDAQAFRADWEINGPMVPGLDPMEAVDRLKKFQQLFEVSFWHHLVPVEISCPKLA